VNVTERTEERASVCVRQRKTAMHVTTSLVFNAAAAAAAATTQHTSIVQRGGDMARASRLAATENTEETNKYG